MPVKTELNQPRASPMARTKSATPASEPHRNQLVQAAMLLKQASDPTRLRILMLLDEEDHNVGRMVEVLGLPSRSATSHHLGLLRHGGLVQTRKNGKSMVYSVT